MLCTLLVQTISVADEKGPNLFSHETGPKEN